MDTLLRNKKGRRSRRPGVEPLEGRAGPATLPPGFAETAFISGLNNPTAMDFSPDGKLFVTEQGGTMEVFQNGTRLETNFFRNTPLTVNSSGERGLLGVAFDPNYAANHFVYVYYTAVTPAVHNRLSRFTADARGTLALAGSERVLLDLDNLSSATNHNGGAVHVGPDGKLYVGVGDNANGANSQSLNTVLGKVLRLNADGSIPTDNPFYKSTTGKNRAIWALGLRNPFTFAFQPGTGRMFINDVGQNTWEEIDGGAAGANYGWPTTEGDFNPTQFPRFTRPFYAYNHGVGQAISGGVFYNPAINQFPGNYQGTYFFADYVSGWIKRIDPATKAVSNFASGINAPVDLKVGYDGSLYYLARGSGAVFQVRYAARKLSAPADFDGDGRTDLGVFRPLNATWNIQQSTAGPLNPTPVFGNTNLTDIPVVGDFDGVGHAEIAVFRPSTAQWIVRDPSAPGGSRVLGTFGAPNLVDIPVPGDYDGVGHTELAVFRPSTAQWFVLGPNGGHLLTTFGAPNLLDLPVPGDYDGVGYTEPAVFRRTTAQWFVLGPGGGRLVGTFGAPNLVDVPAPGDYDGVGHTELAFFRPSTSQWFALGPNGGHQLPNTPFGAPNLLDIPVESPVGALALIAHQGSGSTQAATSSQPSRLPQGPRSLAVLRAQTPITTRSPVPQSRPRAGVTLTPDTRSRPRSSPFQPPRPA
jgi:glucose/arabinose dehydrogenase